MEFIGYTLAFLIGITLGLIGGGGSILTLPVLVYFFSVNEIVATSYSLFVVGSAALIGGVKKLISKEVNLHAVLFFGLPSMLAVICTRKFIIPFLPDILFKIGDLPISKEKGLILFFGIIMLISSLAVLKRKREEVQLKHKQNYFLIITEGILVGTLTGFVGAGGGFIIVPALMVLGKLPIKIAIGTSLVIIALKSLFGFFAGDYLNDEIFIDWKLLGYFSSLSILGVFVGTYIGNFISGKRLKKGFGFFLLIMALVILLKELTEI